MSLSRMQRGAWVSPVLPSRPELGWWELTMGILAVAPGLGGILPTGLPPPCSHLQS